MSMFKKISLAAAVLAMAVLGANNAQASAKGVGDSAPIKDSKGVMSSFKPDDSVVKISGDVYVHGKVTISNLLEPNNPVIEIDSDNNIHSVKAKDIEAGIEPEMIDIPGHIVSPLTGSTPPTQLMNLGVYATASEDFSPGAFWHYADYAYQPVPVVPYTQGLVFSSRVDSMLAGDSEDWTNTNNTQVGYGVYIEMNSELYITGLGNILSCWSWNPLPGSGYTVQNVGY